MKQIMKLLLGVQLLCAGSIWAGYYQIQFIETTYPQCIDFVQTPDGWQVTEYFKKNPGYTAESWRQTKTTGLVCVAAAVVAGTYIYEARTAPDVLTKILLAIVGTATASACGVWAVTKIVEASCYKPDYQPSTFEKDQAQGGYEYYVVAEKKFKTEEAMKRKYPEFSYKYLPTV